MKDSIEQNLKIAICDGVGKIKFGDSTEQVQNILGLPAEATDLGTGIVAWNYPELKLEFIFRSVDSSSIAIMQMVQFTTRHSDATIWNQKIIGQHTPEVIAIFRTHGHDRFKISPEFVGRYSYELLEFDQLNVHLDFRNDLLKSITVGNVVSSIGR